MFLRKSQLNDSFFDNISGHKLDKYQRKVILNNSKYLLVVAAAGSGKTLSIIGKIKYLIEKKCYKENEILCLSFTNETVNNLKRQLNYHVDVFTFHKLALNILKDSHCFYKISSDNFLNYVVNEYFSSLYYNENLSFFLEYFDNKASYNEILKSKKYVLLKYKVISFIKKIKCNNLRIDDIYLMIKKVYDIHDKIFLLFVFDILRIYQEELLSECKIDFDDMISYAINFIKRNGINKKYRYIIIDEYQDISLVRFSLIREILKCTNANLMCVGDDYQSIYGFSGSSLKLFIDFFKYFPTAVRLDIKKTYRNSYQLIRASSKFIMKNKYQLRKNIHATFFKKYPIVIVYYDNNYLETYNNLLNYLYLEKKKNVMVLARYNSELEKIKNTTNKYLNINYLTVHKSKGLECENVILINMQNDYLGFPSKILNDKVFSLIDRNNEEIEYAEERRLFYVALTRCKERVYLLVPKNKPSLFINEIKSDCVELLLN